MTVSVLTYSIHNTLFLVLTFFIIIYFKGPHSMNSSILSEYLLTSDVPNKETLRECISMQQKAACYRQINKIQKLPEKIQVELVVLKFIVKTSLRKCPESKKNQERVFVPGDIVEVIANNVDLNTLDKDIWFFVTKPKKNTHKLWKRSWSEVRKHLSNNGFCSSIRKVDVFETGVTFEEARIKHFNGGRNVTCYKVSVYEGVKPIWFEVDIFKKPAENLSPQTIFDSDEDESSGKVDSIMGGCLKQRKKDEATKITDQIKPMMLDLQKDTPAYQYNNISALLQDKQTTTGTELLGYTLPPPPPQSSGTPKEQTSQSTIMQTPQIASLNKSSSLEYILKEDIDSSLPKSLIQTKGDQFENAQKKDSQRSPLGEKGQSFEVTDVNKKRFYPMFPQYQRMPNALPPIVVRGSSSPQSDSLGGSEYTEFKPYFSKSIFSCGPYQLRKNTFQTATSSRQPPQPITSTLSPLSKQPASIQEILFSPLKKMSPSSLQLPPPPPPQPSASTTHMEQGKEPQIMNSPVSLLSPPPQSQVLYAMYPQTKQLPPSSANQFKLVQAENNVSIQNNVLNGNGRKDFMNGLPPIYPFINCEPCLKKY